MGPSELETVFDYAGRPYVVTILDVMAVAVFVGFVVVGFMATRRHRPTAEAQRAVGLFIAYVIAVSFGVGLSQRISLYPFMKWTLIAIDQPANWRQYRVMVVDDEGSEHLVDYRAWQPFSYWELTMYLPKLAVLDSNTRTQHAAYLLDRAEESRTRARAGGRVGTWGRWLGPLAAPQFISYRALWTDTTLVPARPFVGLRLYRDEWILEERARDSTAVSRTVVYEHRRSP